MGRSMQQRERRSRCARGDRGSLLDPDEFEDHEPDDFDDSYIGANAWAPECEPTVADYLEEEDV